MDDLDELERQMQMLDDIDINTTISTVPDTTPVQQSSVPTQQTVQQSSVPTQQAVPQLTVPKLNIERTSVNAQAQQTVVSQNQIPQKGPDLSIFDTDEAPMFVDLRKAVDEDRIPFVNLQPGESTRIMVFTTDMIKVYTHYIKGLGNIRCLSKREPNGQITDWCPCCQFVDEDSGKQLYAKTKWIMPVIQYPVANDR